MTVDEYLRSILSKYEVVNGIFTPANVVKSSLTPLISQWAGQQLNELFIAGSFAKGTGIKGSTDIDIFISLKSNTSDNLSEIYDKLYRKMLDLQFNPRKQNVSIGIQYSGYSVDLVPGKQQQGYINYHSIYKNKAKSWTQTNIQEHIKTVRNSGRINEIKLAKIWRNLNNLDFPSFYLELTVLNALKGCTLGDLQNNFVKILQYLRNSFTQETIYDPANSANKISDDLSLTEKQHISRNAQISLTQNWNQILR